MHSALAIILLMFLLLPLSVQAEEARFKVMLAVTADETNKPQILSYLRRELRSLGKIQLDKTAMKLAKDI